MNTGCRFAMVAATLGLAVLAGCQQPLSTDLASGTKKAESAAPARAASIERPRILDDSGKVVSEFHFPPGQNERVIKLTQVGGLWLTRELKINGHDVGWMLIDTGANVTTVDKRIADDLGLKSLKKSGGSGDYDIMRGVDRIELTDIALNNHFVAVTDFSSLRATTGVLIRGSLGGDFLGQAPFCLDFTEGTLTFYERSRFRPPAGAREVRIQLTGKATSGSIYARANPMVGSPLVIGQIGGVRCGLTLDTGTSGAPTILPRLSREHPELVDWESGDQKDVTVPEGSVGLSRASVHDIVLFGQRIRLAEIDVQIEAASFRGAPTDLQAVVGTTLLENYRLTFDYASERMWVINRSLPTVAARLAAGMDPNAPNLAQTTPLMVAAERGDSAGVKALLQAGARAEGHNAVGRTALRFAVEGGNPEVVEALLKACSTNVNEPTAKGVTPLMEAMGKPSEEALAKMLLEAGADVSLVDRDDESAAHWAARRSGGAAIALLAAKHADLNAANNKGIRPLDLAATKGCVGALEALWRAGARSEGKGGATLLYLAAMNRNPAMVRHVLKGQEGPVVLEARATDGMTALMIAAYAGRVEPVRALLEAGADPNLVADNHANVLCYAAKRAEITALLLKAGADVNPASSAQVAPLVAAAGQGDAKVVELLLNAGAKVNLVSEAASSHTALMEAAIENHPEVIELLAKHKANLEMRTEDGTTVLMVAADKGAEALAMLLKCGADVHAARPDGATALHFAAQMGNAASAQMLLHAGAKIEAVADKGQRPLHLAVAYQQIEVTRMLLTAGADPQAAMSNGHTALDIAHAKGDAEAVKLLEDAIAKRHAATKPGK